MRNQDFATFDIHDRVNYSVKKSELCIEKDSHVELRLQIDTEICAVMDYFEIFMKSSDFTKTLYFTLIVFHSQKEKRIL